jgi:hypothetical protein
MIKSMNSSAYIELIRQLISARKNANLTGREVDARLGEQVGFTAKTETYVRKLSVLEYFQYTAALGLSAAEGMSILLNMKNRL